MSDDINIALIVILYSIVIISFVFYDWIYAKIRLRGYNPIVAEVIYFDKVSFSFTRGSTKVTIVSYESDGLQHDAVILKAKKDKIGDKIEIVTDGKIAVRKKVVLKEDQPFVSLFGMLIFFICFDQNETMRMAIYLVLIIGLVYLFFHPVVYDVFDRAIKDKLGWRK